MFIYKGNTIVAEHEKNLVMDSFNASSYDKTKNGFIEYANDLERIAKRNGGTIDISLILPSIMPTFLDA